MEHVNNTPLEQDMPKVTGRKAARSLRLFRGDGYGVDPLMEIDPQEENGVPHITGLDGLASQTLSATTRDSDPNTSPQAKLSPAPLAGDRARQQLVASPAREETERNDQKHRPLLEPVSSATYFPHTPIKDNQELEIAIDDSTETGTLQHLMADLEFDHGSHGDITKIKKHKQDEDKSPEKVRVALHPQADAAEVESISSEVYPLTVELRPFKNKVGGHTAIFRFSKKAVCKALMNRENLWYEAVERKHLDVLNFMPKYIGVLNVRYSSLVTEDTRSPNFGPTTDEALDQDSLAHRRRPSLPAYDKLHRRINVTEDEIAPEVSLDDNRHIIPDLLWKQYSNSAPNSSGFVDNPGTSPKLPMDQSTEGECEDFSIGSTSVNTDLQAQVILEVFIPQGRRSDDIFQMDDEVDEGVSRGSSGENSVDTGHTDDDVIPPSPKIESVLRKHTRFERFILLEDLTANMQKPCALDLKMGTRQYGVEANEKKQASQRKKCKQTTSRELGVRVCGLQVWNESKLRFFMRDKYFGRRLRSGLPFAKILAKFLYDGTSVFSIVAKIPGIIKQLMELYIAFEKLAGYRMYGSSVLLMYDGASLTGTEEVKVHIIDFAQSVIGEDTALSQYSRPPKFPELPDRGYLRGLRSLMRYYKDIFQIISGDNFDQIDNMGEYLEKNKERLNKACYWIGTYAEEDGEETSSGDSDGRDPFDIHYVSNDDETGISD